MNIQELNCYEKFLSAVLGISKTRDPFIDYPIFLKVDKEGRSQEQAVLQLLSMLDSRKKAVLIRRFGLEGYDTQTLEEIGKELGVSGSRIREIEVGALRFCRHPRNSRLLASYYYEPTLEDDQAIKIREHLFELLRAHYPASIAHDLAKNIKRRYLGDALQSLQQGGKEGVAVALSASCRVAVSKCLQCQKPTIPGWTFCSDECRKDYRNVLLVCDCGCGQEFHRKDSMLVYRLGKKYFQHVFLNKEHAGRWVGRQNRGRKRKNTK